MADAQARLDPLTFLNEYVAPRSRRRIEELRAQVARLEREIEDRRTAEGTVELVLEGDGGGRWFLNLRDGETRVSDKPDAPPLVRITQRREDWEALARAELTAERGGAVVGGDLSRSRIERLRGLRGTLEFHLVIDEGERVLAGGMILPEGG